MSPIKKIFDIACRMQSAKVEKDVENNYREAFSYYYNPVDIEISSPFSCDGFLKFKEKPEEGYLFHHIDGDFDEKELKKPRILFEFKFDEDFQKKTVQAEVILQTIFYLKKFELEGNDGINFPSIIFIGDKNECFFIHTNDVLKYLDKNIDWSFAPSSVGKTYPDLVIEISEDSSINPFPFVLKNEDFQELTEKILLHSESTKQHIRITEHNIDRIFSQFDKNVLTAQNLTPEERVSIFIGSIIDQNSFYLHPKKKNTLITPQKSDGVKVNSEKYNSFFSYFKGDNYTIDERRKFTEIQDRLIDELSRRKSGEYFTPTIWADEAHKMISESFGEDWKEKYIVWDCACGTKNLTRDYSFNKLYLSTLFQSDLDVSKKYNKEHLARTFQYDFLNDDVDFLDYKDELFENKLKLPKELIEDLKADKPIIFFMNPPYGTANADGAKGDGALKKGMAQTLTNKKMVKESLGNSAQQLFAQFLYNIILLKNYFKLTNFNICLFANPIFLSGGSFSEFRKFFLDNLKFEKAMLFCAKHFADVSDDWGISFSLWKSGLTTDKENFEHIVKDYDNFDIVEIDKKVIYNTDFSESCSDWAKGDFYYKYRKKIIDYPQISSPINIQPKGRGGFIDNCIGFNNNLANNIYQSEGGVGIFSSAYSGGNGYPIMPEYFDNIISNFVARRLGFSLETWINQKDEFLKPNTEHPEYQNYLNDALIFTVFNPKAKVSSLRNVDYKNKKWNIINEFFFMSISDIKKLADDDDNEEVYNDIIAFPNERFLFNKIKTATFSKEAQDVYDFSVELVKKSFKYRKLLNDEYPEYNFNSWDAGWYQVKYLVDKYLNDDFKKFDRLYKILFEKWKPYVYTLGFLKK